MGTAVVNDVGASVGSPPGDQILTKHCESNSFARYDFLGLKNRVPIISESTGQARRQVGRHVFDAGRNFGDPSALCGDVDVCCLWHELSLKWPGTRKIQ